MNLSLKTENSGGEITLLYLTVCIAMNTSIGRHTRVLWGLIPSLFMMYSRILVECGLMFLKLALYLCSDLRNVELQIVIFCILHWRTLFIHNVFLFLKKWKQYWYYSIFYICYCKLNLFMLFLLKTLHLVPAFLFFFLQRLETNLWVMKQKGKQCF